jgi:hypothetical protein
MLRAGAIVRYRDSLREIVFVLLEDDDRPGARCLVLSDEGVGAGSFGIGQVLRLRTTIDLGEKLLP